MFFILALSINSEARGIGMRGGNLIVAINYVPNFEQTYYYSVIPYTDEPMDITMEVENDNRDGTTSDLSKYLIVEPVVFSGVMPRQEPFFSVTVRLPKEIKEPGTHKLHVTAVEALKNSEGIAVRAGVEAIFYINVPYEGQYLTYSMETENVNQGTPIPITLSLSNLGKEPINELYADIVLFDSQKNKMDSVKTETIEMKGQENAVLRSEVKSIGLVAGEYVVNATVHYDGKQVSRAQKIKVGELKLSIINQTKEIVSGKVNEIDVEIESEWAETVKNVYAQIQIGNNPVIKTLSEDLLGFQKITLKAFFDATNVKPGIYDMLIKAYYEEKLTSKTVKINVVKGESAEFANGKISFTNILMAVIILVVVIINIVLFKILLKKKDENEKTK